MSMNVKKTFVLASLLMGHLPFFQASANEQTRNEVREALLSIQAELNDFDGRNDDAPPSPIAPLAQASESEPAIPTCLTPSLRKSHFPNPRLYPNRHPWSIPSEDRTGSPASFNRS